eukprot:gene13952-16041_t
MFFPSRKTDSSEATTSPASKGGNTAAKSSRNGKANSPQKTTSRPAPVKSTDNRSLVSVDKSPVGSLNAILSARPGGDDNVPTADSEQLVARLFKGLGVPMYQPRIPIVYKTEPIPRALKDYRWKAFDLTISHDTMLTIAKPPPPPPPAREEPPSPPVEELDEPRLLITNVTASELESPTFQPPEIEPIQTNVGRSMKIDRLASQKMRPSAKVTTFSKKASVKLLTEFNDWKEARSTKNGNVEYSIKMMQSSKVSTTPEEATINEDPDIGNFDKPETKEAIERKKSMIPNSFLEDVESEQLIDGLLDMSVAAGTSSDPIESPEPAASADADTAPAAAKNSAEDSSVVAANTESTVNAEADSVEVTAVPDIPSEAPVTSKLASVKINPAAPPVPSKSVKSPNSSSFFSSLLSSISSKVPGFGGDGKGSDEDEDVIKPTAPSSKSTKKISTVEDTNAPSLETKETEESKGGVSERKTGSISGAEEVPSETHFDFYAEAAKLAAEATVEATASEQEQEAQQSTIRAPPAVSFTIDGWNNKKQTQSGTIISPAERSVFKPTFAMPRPTMQEQNTLAAMLVRNLQGGSAKKVTLQTDLQNAEGPSAPLSGPKNKKKRDNFSVLEELFLDGQPSPPPPNALKYAADLQNSDSEGESSVARSQGKAKQGKKTPKQTKKLSPAKPQNWYLAGAYSLHHEAIDAINRLHKLLAGAAADPNDPSLDLDNKFRLQRDLSRMQWIVECSDAQHKAMVLSHATRVPVIPEKDKSKFRNIVGAIKEDASPVYQGAGAGIYHSPPQAKHPDNSHPNGSDHKRHPGHGHPHDEHFLRERDAFFENNMRMVKANLSPNESPPQKQAARRQAAQHKQHSPPPRGSGASAEKNGAAKEGNGSSLSLSNLFLK